MTMNILFFDVETSGIPRFDRPADDPSQPRICQVGAILCTGEPADDAMLAERGHYECLVGGPGSLAGAKSELEFLKSLLPKKQVKEIG